MPRNALGSDPEENMVVRTVPIITSPTPTPTIKTSAPSPSAGDPMEITTPTNPSGPPTRTQTSSKSPEREGLDPAERQNAAASKDHASSLTASRAMPAPAAAAVHQPKIVQTAFIHKLYNMLEDPNIQHLISWSASEESFVMSPSHDFSKVLAQYFKHTNISSFVRQLNMYGFHKVSDVFHTGNPDSALWEFKHGNGNFKRGDLAGLREIKRRASRHALVHREYNNQKPTPSQPGTPAEPVPPLPEGSDPRLSSIENTLFELTSRLQRSEDAAHYMHIKQQAMVETVNRLLQYNHELSRTVLSLVPPDNPIYRDGENAKDHAIALSNAGLVAALQGEIQRQSDHFRSLDEPQEPPYSSRSQYFANIDNLPVSPRQLPQDDQRRVGMSQSRGNFHRPAVPSNLSVNSRRPYGSIGGNTAPSSPSPLRPQPPPPAPAPLQHTSLEPLPGSLARRHTSADIRAHGWQANQPAYPPSGPPPLHWPPSPSRAPVEDPRVRESFSHYPSAGTLQSHSRPATPPPFSNGIHGLESLSSWSWNSASRENKNLAVKDSSLPPTRRGSMAHILNPTDTYERDEEDPRSDDDYRKRKRLH
ncbi:hypothetical protein DL768_002701 [Monosporascus sp. mg162]|nr:hypothetical protein DL768_002701 [Monosporascus sp. mg162]